MKANLKQQQHIYERFLNKETTVSEEGISGFISYSQMAKVVKYLNGCETWRPSEGDTYYYAQFLYDDFEFRVDSCTWYESETDLDNLLHDNVYRTIEEAAAFVAQLNKGIRKAREAEK